MSKRFRVDTIDCGRYVQTTLLRKFAERRLVSRNPVRVTLAVAALLLLIQSGAVPQNASNAAKPQEPTADAAAGKPIFERYCAPCHGINGGGGRGPRLNRPRLTYAPTDAALRSVIADGIPPAMPDAWYLSDEEIANVAAHIRALGKTPGELVPGDPVRGAAIYARSGCSSCHILRGQGVGFGPDLTSVGDRRNASFVRTVINKPSSALPEGFLFVTVVTAEGKSVSGIRLNEDSFTIQLKDPTGKIYSFRKRDLKRLNKEAGSTPMPAFEKVLSAKEVEDLAAFLMASRENP